MQTAHESPRWSRRREQYHAKPLTTPAEIAELATGDTETVRPSRDEEAKQSARTCHLCHRGLSVLARPRRRHRARADWQTREWVSGGD